MVYAYATVKGKREKRKQWTWGGMCYALLYFINIISFKLHNLIKKSIAIFILQKRKVKVRVRRRFS